MHRAKAAVLLIFGTNNTTHEKQLKISSSSSIELLQRAAEGIVAPYTFLLELVYVVVVLCPQSISLHTRAKINTML